MVKSQHYKLAVPYQLRRMLYSGVFVEYMSVKNRVYYICDAVFF